MCFRFSTVSAISRWLLLTVIVVSCGSGSDSAGGPTPPAPTPPAPPPPTPTISVALDAATATATPTFPAVIALSVTRGGGFTGAVALTAENVPVGITAVFADATLGSGVSATTLTLAVGATAVAGTTAITVRANGTGVAASTAIVRLTVQPSAPPSPPATIVEWTFCDPSRFPAFFAVQDKGSSQWRVVSPTAGQRYAFSFSQDVGTVAIVQLAPRNRQFPAAVFATYMTVYKGSSAELKAFLGLECGGHPARSKTLMGSVAPEVGAQQLAYVSAGWGNAFVSPGSSAFALVDVEPSASVDLLATRFALRPPTGVLEPERFIVRRGLNEPPNARLQVLDFGSSEAFVPAAATISVANLNGDRWSLRSALLPERSAELAIFETSETTGASRTQFGLPVERLVPSELQTATITSVNASNTSSRKVVDITRAVADRTLTLGPALSSPVISTANGAYARPRVRGTMQAAYNRTAQVVLTQASPLKHVWIEEFAGFRGASDAYDLEVPDLSGVSGFNTAWGLTLGTPTFYSVTLSNVNTAGPFGYTPQVATWLFGSIHGQVP